MTGFSPLGGEQTGSMSRNHVVENELCGGSEMEENHTTGIDVLKRNGK